MSVETPATSGRIGKLLRSGPFARYMRGEAISMTGTWMQLMAQSWVMTTLTSSAVMLGMVNFATGVPMIALSMIGGSFADRADKRNILLVTQVVQILLAVLVGWLVATGRFQIHSKCRRQPPWFRNWWRKRKSQLPLRLTARFFTARDWWDRPWQGLSS